MNRKLGSIVIGALALALAACTMTRLSAMDRGAIDLREGRHEAAFQRFDDAVKAMPRSAAAWNNRGIARVRLGDLVGALGDLTRAIELAPTDPELYFNRGDIYVALGNHDYAVQDFSRAIDLAPGYARAYFNRGTARLRNGDQAGAHADWRYAVAIEADPWTQAAMVRSAGLGAPATRAAVAAIPGTLPQTPVAAPPPAASPAFIEPTPQTLDARALAARAITRELDGDRAGALADLRAARAMEADAQRRTSLETLIRALETGR